MSNTAARSCIFCGEAPVTREHVFRSTWKSKLPYLDGERSFVQHRWTGKKKTERPDRPFELVVKRTCAACNNGWMNKLDSHVEPWVLDPSGFDMSCDPTEFRRWAIKVALLRAFLDSPAQLPPHPDDLAPLYAGDDIPDWHVFVGRSVYPEHRHNHCAVGPVIAGVGRGVGATQVSWSLGTALVTTLRIMGTDAGPSVLASFREYNKRQGAPFAEIRPGAKRFPNVYALPEVPNGQILSYYWFTSPHSVSPIAGNIRVLDAAVMEAAHRSGRIADLVD